MKVEYVNPFIKATHETFKKMMMVDLEVGSPLKHKNRLDHFYVSSNIGLSGEAQGVISLCYTSDSAYAYVARFVGSDQSVSENEMIDGIGEIVNIVAGYAKNFLTQFSIDISLPNVVLGDDHGVWFPKGTDSIVVPLNSGIGRFAMEVALKTP